MNEQVANELWNNIQTLRTHNQFKSCCVLYIHEKINLFHCKSWCLYFSCLFIILLIKIMVILQIHNRAKTTTRCLQ